jgi:hypothetical protein
MTPFAATVSSGAFAVFFTATFLATAGFALATSAFFAAQRLFKATTIPAFGGKVPLCVGTFRAAPSRSAAIDAPTASRCLSAPPRSGNWRAPVLLPTTILCDSR